MSPEDRDCAYLSALYAVTRGEPRSLPVLPSRRTGRRPSACCGSTAEVFPTSPCASTTRPGDQAPMDRALPRGGIDLRMLHKFGVCRSRAYRVTDRLTLWGMGGLGSGTMTVTQEEDPGIETDIAMRMGALGAKGALVEAPPGGGFSFNLKSDILHVQMESDAVTGSQGSLEGAEADVVRYRLILEGARAFALAGDATLTPTFEVGLRHDAGDAETGTGLEVGGRIAYARAGIAVEGAARALVAHEESGYEEWGASGSIRIDPGAARRGLSFTLSPVWGSAGSRTGQLWGVQDTRGLAPEGEFEPTGRVETELGYGITVPHGPGVVTPYTGMSWAEEGGRTHRAGARWNLGLGAVLGLESVHQQGSGGEAGTREIRFRTELRW